MTQAKSMLSVVAARIIVPALVAAVGLGLSLSALSLIA